MKWIVVLMTCFVVNIINVDGLCQVTSSIDYDPEKLNGLWYITYTVPDIYKKFVDVGLIYQLQGNSYDTTVLGTPAEEGEEQVYKATVYIRKNNNTLTYQSTTMPLFNGDYRIASADFSQYLIFQGCAPGLYDGETVLGLFREKCADKETQNVATMAAKQLGMDVSAFVMDPTLDCSQ